MTVTVAAAVIMSGRDIQAKYLEVKEDNKGRNGKLTTALEGSGLRCLVECREWPRCTLANNNLTRAERGLPYCGVNTGTRGIPRLRLSVSGDTYTRP